MKSRMFRWLSICTCLTGLLQAQVNAPKIGFARFSDGTLRPVYGLAAAFVIGHPIADSVDAASFSDAGGLISTKGRLQLFNDKASLVAAYDSNETAPVLNVDGPLSSAIAWLPSSQTVVRWDGASFQKTIAAGPLPGHVASIRLAGDAAELLILADQAVSEITMSLDSGNLLSSQFLSTSDGIASQVGQFRIVEHQRTLEIESLPATLQTLSIPASNLHLEPMSSGWIHLFSPESSRHWAVHLIGKQFETFALPAIPAGSVTGGAQ